MDFDETVEFLYSRLPYFTRDGKAAIKKDLNNIRALCEVLGNPHEKFRCIHVAGTNGKGSVSNMLAAILQEHGYKTGLYTSPHLKDFRERIRINGDMISKEFVVEFTERILPHIDRIQPSFFEITVAMCFEYFAQNTLDFAVIETGLGGRLDSTNIISPILSVITNIGFDHKDMLGDTLEKIAFEKAGIIKEKVPVVIGETHPETEPVFRNKALESQSPVHFADSNVLYYNTRIDTDLQGEYQQKNLVTVMQSVDVLRELGIPLDPFVTARALMHVSQLTGFRGRWEILGKNPLIIADTAHNAHGLALVVEQLMGQRFRRLHMVLGMLRDKEREPLLDLLPGEAHYYFCQPALPRALDATILQKECAERGLKGETFPTVGKALEAAKMQADPADLIFIGGSTFVVAEII